MHLFEIFKYLCVEGTKVKYTKRKREAIETFSLYFVTRRLVVVITNLHNLF